MKTIIYHHSPLLITTGMLLLLIGFIIRYHIGRRRFNRRGIAGLQHFKSYACAVFTTLVENLCQFFATLCIISAVVLLAIAWLS